MSTDLHHGSQHSGAEPVHTDVAWEQADVSPGAIYIYLFGLAVAVILSYVVCVFVLRGTTSVVEKFDKAPPPIRQAMGRSYQTMPPEPRLQGVPGHGNDPQADLREKLEQDTRAMKRYEMDQSSGMAQIPIDEAMKMIVEKGLPGAPSGGTEVNK
jgi:hypothetical protein